MGKALLQMGLAVSVWFLMMVALWVMDDKGLITRHQHIVALTASFFFSVCGTVLFTEKDL
jgi:hypothetical protein